MNEPKLWNVGCNTVHIAPAFMLETCQLGLKAVGAWGQTTDNAFVSENACRGFMQAYLTASVGAMLFNFSSTSAHGYTFTARAGC